MALAINELTWSYQISKNVPAIWRHDPPPDSDFYAEKGVVPFHNINVSDPFRRATSTRK